MHLNTYLTFSGNCREAFEFYCTVFGGSFAAFRTFAEAPAEIAIPEDKRHLVMHVSLPIGTSVLMGSDDPFGEAIPSRTGYAISVSPDTKDQCDRLFAELSMNGDVAMPLQKTFWGAWYGKCTDRFGIDWIFNCALPQTYEFVVR